MHRTLKAIALAAALSATAGGAVAQDFVFGWNPRSGDVWVDNRLADVNQYGVRYRDPFIDEMTRYYGAPRDLVNDLLVNRRWAPGDIYYACALAQSVGQPCRNVVNEWERDHGQGWGVIAQRMGIKPGSAEFHRLKQGFVPTYDRWGRPIEVDDDLRSDFPNRGKGRNGTALRDRSGKSGDEHGKRDDRDGRDKQDHGNRGERRKQDHGKPAAYDKGGRGKSVDHGNRGKHESGKQPSGKGPSEKGKGNGKG